MTLSESQTENTGVEVFFFKYRKVITVVCILLLVCSPFEIFFAHDLGPGHTYQKIGSWLNDAFTYIAIPLGMLIYTRKATKAHFKEVAVIDQKLKDREVNL
jgi:ACR3 family arsenite efflux pump ArsB